MLRLFAAAGVPSMSRWPHKNTPEAIRARHAALRALPQWDSANDFVLDTPVDGLEALTGHMLLPVAIVGPLRLQLGAYHLSEAGQLIEHARDTEDVFVPLAHTEAGLSASMLRGMNAVRDSGHVRTYILNDRITRDSCFVFSTTQEALALARWVTQNTQLLRAWLHDPLNPLYEERVGGVPRLSRHAKLWEIDTHVLGTTCHVLYRYSTGDACGPNMITRNSYALNQELVGPRFFTDTGISPRHVFLEGNMGGDKKPSAQYFVAGGHGKTVLAEATLSDETLRRVLRTSATELAALEHVGLHGSHASDMQSVAFTPASAIAAIFAATGQDLGMVGTSSMAHGTLEVVDGGIHAAIRLPSLEVGTVGGGTGLPHARAYVSLLGCTRPDGAYRLAQIVAAAALCLEISASAAMASAGSANFAAAHTRASGRSS
jgi:hydroxymethylglutaryl-CoA reductase (NADPH)